MPHNAGDYVVAQIIPGSPVINYADATYLGQILCEDAGDYLYSGVISLANAFTSIRAGFYSWSTVKLYYATFYMIRGLLAQSGICILYVGSKPKVLKAAAGEQIRNPPGGKRSATTHGVVLETAKRELPDHLIFSQPIAGVHPLDWMRERQEESNYWHSRFVEPAAPDHMKMIQRYGLRRLVVAYLGDTLSFAFDPDHAVIAYPILVWQKLREQLLVVRPPVFDDNDQGYLRSLFFDSAGALSAVHVLLGSV
jgi:hypothetical protein